MLSTMSQRPAGSEAGLLGQCLTIALCSLRE